jgi:hypothetical protein
VVGNLAALGSSIQDIEDQALGQLEDVVCVISRRAEIQPNFCLNAPSNRPDVVPAVREHRQFVQIFGEPGCGPRQTHEAVFDQTHDLFGLRSIAADRVQALADEFLDQLGARGLVLDRDDIWVEAGVLVARRALQLRVFHAPAQNVEGGKNRGRLCPSSCALLAVSSRVGRPANNPL